MYISFSVNCLFLFFTYFPTEFLDFSQFLEVLWEFRLSSAVDRRKKIPRISIVLKILNTEGRIARINEKFLKRTLRAALVHTAL